MVTSIKKWFTNLKTWQKVVVGFVAFSLLISPFTGSGGGVASPGDPSSPPEVTIAPAPTATEMPQETQATSDVTVGQRNAIEKALSYLNFAAFSKKGLVEQLKFEGFSTEDSSFAVNNIDVDWFEQAALKAENYLNFSAFSRKGLIDQLIFEGFTEEEAVYGVDQTGL